MEILKDKLDKYTVTIPKQLKKVCVTRLVLTLVMAFLGLFIILQLGGVIAYIASVLMILVEISYMYMVGYEIADHDIKSFSILKPYWWKGFALYTPIFVVSCIIGVLYCIFLSEGIVYTPYHMLLNFVFISWIMPYYPFTVADVGNISVIGFFASVILPMLFLGIGYIAGMKGFDLSKITDKFIYEEKGR